MDLWSCQTWGLKIRKRNLTDKQIERQTNMQQTDSKTYTKLTGKLKKIEKHSTERETNIQHVGEVSFYTTKFTTFRVSFTNNKTATDRHYSQQQKCIFEKNRSFNFDECLTISMDILKLI